jgi:hypothetical protein
MSKETVARSLLAAGGEEQGEAGRREEARQLESRTSLTSEQHGIRLHESLADPEDEEGSERGQLQRQVIRILGRHRVVKQQQADLRTEEAQDAGGTPRASHHQDDAEEGDQAGPDRRLSRRDSRADGEEYGDGREDDRELTEEFAALGHGDEGDAEGHEELDQRGLRRTVADPHLIKSIRRPGGELPDGETGSGHDLTEVGALGGEAKPAPEKAGADERDLEDADDRRNGGTEVKPDAKEHDRGHGEHAADPHGPPSTEGILALEVARREESEVTETLEERIGLSSRDRSDRRGRRFSPDRKRRRDGGGLGHRGGRRHGGGLRRDPILQGAHRLLQFLDLRDQDEEPHWEIDHQSQQSKDSAHAEDFF